MRDNLCTREGLWLNSLHEFGRLLSQSSNPEVLRAGFERLQRLKDVCQALNSNLQAYLPDYKQIVEELMREKASSHQDSLYFQLLEDSHLPSSQATQDEYNRIVTGGIAQWISESKEQLMDKFSDYHRQQLYLVWIANDLHQALQHQRVHSTEEVPQSWNATITKLRDACGEKMYETCSQEAAIWMIECQYAWDTQLLKDT